MVKLLCSVSLIAFAQTAWAQAEVAAGADILDAFWIVGAATTAAVIAWLAFASVRRKSDATISHVV